MARFDRGDCEMQRPRLEKHRVAGSPFAAILLLASLGCAVQAAAGDDGRLALRLRSRVEVPAGSGQFRVVERAAAWDPKTTAIIVCDMWDLHHCLNATRRGAEI